MSDPQTRPALQQPDWPDQAAVRAVSAELSGRPGLVLPGECDDLRSRLAEVAAGRAFLLHGGDCAETFDAIRHDIVRRKVATLLQMAVVLTYGALVPVVKVGRMAGQYAKPRSSGVERRGDVELPAYRGDAVNGFDFTPEARTPDPRRLLEAYSAASTTLNLIRAFTQGGLADLRQVHAWNAGFVRDSPAMQAYESMAADIERALAFMAACGVEDDEFHKTSFFASHEALLLDYERPLVRPDERPEAPAGQTYSGSGHFLWVGERTRRLDGAHIDFAARIANPIGVKLGPTTSPDDALALIERLDPARRAGRLTLITRMGAGRVRDALPPLIEKVTASGAQVAWVCDPMHGNTVEAPSGHKTRRFEDVVDEVRGFFEVHRALGTWPGGISVELTGDDVTECLGGSMTIDEADLQTRYETACDPRLNHSQSLELAFLVAGMLRQPA